MIFKTAFLIYIFISIPLAFYEAGKAKDGVKRSQRYLIGNGIWFIVMFYLAYFYWDG